MVDQCRATYDAGIYRADQQFARLMEAVERRSSSESTVIVVGADHGESVGERHRFDHNRLQWGIFHVPLLVRLPDGQHELRSHPVMNVDIVPTVLDLLGIVPGRSLRGRSLFDAGRDDYLQFAGCENARSVKSGVYLLSVHRQPDRTSTFLFDVATDPDDTHDLEASQPTLVATLMRSLAGFGTLAVSSTTTDQPGALGCVAPGGGPDRDAARGPHSRAAGGSVGAGAVATTRPRE